MTLDDPMTRMTRLCGAKTRAGSPCRLPAGHGSPHAGVGRCRRHGGNSPGGIKAAAKEQARQAIVETGMHVGVEVEPHDALLGVLHLAFGQLTHATARVAEMGTDTPEARYWLTVQAELQDRVANYSRVALQLGVAEQRLRLIERTAEHIAAAAEDALSELSDVTAHQRAAFVRRFAGRLALIERPSG